MTVWCQCVLSYHYNDCLMSMCVIMWLQWLFGVNLCDDNDCLMSICVIMWLQWLFGVNFCYRSLQWLDLAMNIVDVNLCYHVTTMTVWCQYVILCGNNDRLARFLVTCCRIQFANMFTWVPYGCICDAVQVSHLIAVSSTDGFISSSWESRYCPSFKWHFNVCYDSLC